MIRFARSLSNQWNRLRFATLLASLLPIASVPAAEAREQKAALITAIDNFNAAMAKGEFAAIIDASIPPALLQYIADQHKVEVDKVKARVIRQMAEGMKAVKIVSFSMDKSAIRYGETAGGIPYALALTETVMEIQTQQMRATSETLGLFDNGRWYLVRISDPQQAVLVRAVYPQFEAVDFKTGEMELI